MNYVNNFLNGFLWVSGAICACKVFDTFLQWYVIVK